jgi:LysM repeat protein
MELFFDTTQDRTDVRDQTSKITDLLKIDSELHAPPILEVAWASLNFQCVLARANQKFIRFLEDGRPVRSKINVTFNEFIDAEHESKEVNRQTADFTKIYMATGTDTLSGIAAKFYDDAELWRPIAVANNIDDPRAIAAGLELRIPSLPYLSPETGEPVN